MERSVEGRGIIDAGRLRGLTGVVNRDGVLTPEQYDLLNKIQAKAADGIMAHWDKREPDGNFPLVAMATGIGKGKIIHEVIRRQKALKPDSRILILAGTKLALVHQMRASLTRYIQSDQSMVSSIDLVESENIDDENAEVDETGFGEIEFSGYAIGKYGERDKDVQIATLQRIKSEDAKSRLNPSDYDLVVVDEVHNAGTEKVKDVIRRFQKVVGFTATPVRYSGEMKGPEEYGFETITSYPLPDAQMARLLPPLYALQINTSELVDKVPTNSTGRIDFRALEKMLKNNPHLRQHIVGRIIPIITLNNRHYKTVVAVNFVWEAQEIAELLKDKGIKVGVAVNQVAAKAIHSEEIPALDSIERYKLPEDNPNSIQVLVSPYVASEGFDAPATEMLVWASPTDSHLRYTQYTGRLARRENGKAYGVVIDCLYQTSQFGWTYNFAMWMKGNVRELENGMLYLGPMQQIQDFLDLQRMHDLADKTILQDIQTGQLLEIQEDDFSLATSNLRDHFIGGRPLFRLAGKVVSKLREQFPENPDLFAKRINGTRIIDVCTNRLLFMQSMQQAGAIPRETEGEVRDLNNEYLRLTAVSLSSIFTGDWEILKSLVDEVKNKLRDQGFGKLIQRKVNQSQGFEVCTDRNRFVRMMVEAGAKLKPSDRVQSGDFITNSNRLREIFQGSYEKLDILINKAKARIKLEYPDRYDGLFLGKIDAKRPVLVCTDRELFIRTMVEVGAKYKDH